MVRLLFGSALVLLALALLIAFAFPVSAADSYLVTVGATEKVDEHGECRMVTNPAGEPATRMVPTKSAPEWTSVRDNPNGLTLAACSGGGCADTWTARNASEVSGWNAVAYGNGTYVAVATGGTNRVMTSADGITWTSRTAAEATQWYSVAYGNGLFVAVAAVGTNQVMTSPDGITWTARTAAQANSWYSVTYGNGLFVAVAGSGTSRVMTSPDGITWTSRTAAQANTWMSVTYGNGLFVAVAFNGTNRVMTSPNGITWTVRNAAAAIQWQSVAHGEGMFVAVGNSGGASRAMSSPDGITWTARANGAMGWRAVTYGGGMFVAVGNSGGARLTTSPDGITWTPVGVPLTNQWVAVTYGGGRFVAVAEAGTNQVMTSPCEEEGGGSCEHDIWTARESNRSWYGVASSADGTKLVAVVSGGQIYTSTDSGATWTARASNRNWGRIASSADGTKLVATVQSGQIYTSTDSGVTWTARDSNRGWIDVASSADGAKLVAAVNNGRIYTSADSGVTWTARDSVRRWTGVASSADGTKLVALGGHGSPDTPERIYTSTDSGVTWTARAHNDYWGSVASSADGTKLVAGMLWDTKIYTSTDSGVTWTPRVYGGAYPMPRLASSADGIRLAMSTGQDIYISSDSGVTWTAQNNIQNWYDIASSADGSKLAATVYGGQIYTSACESGGGGGGPTDGYLVMTNGTWNGNLGGLSGADAKCLSDLQANNWLGKDTAALTAANVKAFLCTGTTCNQAMPNTLYKYARSGSATAGGASFTTDGDGTGPGDTAAWSGTTKFNLLTGAYYWTNRQDPGDSNTQWGNQPDSGNAGDTCGDWTTIGGQGYGGRYGSASNTGAGRWANGSELGCNTAQRLLCIVNPTGGGGPPACAGTEVGGFCWYFGAANQSCDAVCSTHGGCNATGTVNYAGSGGNITNCRNVLDALGVLTYPDPPFNVAASNSGGIPLGCHNGTNTFSYYCYTATSGCNQSYSAGRRACACNN